MKRRGVTQLPSTKAGSHPKPIKSRENTTIRNMKERDPQTDLHGAFFCWVPEVMGCWTVKDASDRSLELENGSRAPVSFFIRVRGYMFEAGYAMHILATTGTSAFGFQSQASQTALASWDS